MAWSGLCSKQASRHERNGLVKLSRESSYVFYTLREEMRSCVEVSYILNGKRNGWIDDGLKALHQDCLVRHKMSLAFEYNLLSRS